MNILVVGSSGFIGSELVNYINSKDGINCIPLKRTKEQPDIGIAFDELKLTSIDVVIYVIGLAHKTELSQDLVRDNDRLALNVILSRLVSIKVRKFVLLSSITAYGRNISLIDKDSIISPNDFVGSIKREIESTLIEYCRDKLKLTIVRSCLVADANAPGNIGRLVSLLSKCRFLLIPEINNNRSFVTLHGLCHILFSAATTPNNDNKYVIASNLELSTSELFYYLNLGINARIFTFPLPRIVPFYFLFLIGKKTLFHTFWGDLLVDNTLKGNGIDIY